MANNPNNYAPVTRRSLVAHQPGQKVGEKIKSGKDFSVEFDDALLSLGGWVNPRLDGCEITSLHLNKFSKKGTSKQLGGIKSPNIQHLTNLVQVWEGDSGNLDRNPAVQTYTNTVFFGATLSGYQEDARFPNVGEDFSYIFINKAFTFDPENDEFFITELLGPDDKVFERVLKQDMSYSSKFTFKLLDEGIEHDLEDEYNVHWNAGLFSLMATYNMCLEAPYNQEMQLTTQQDYLNSTKNYYGIDYNPYLTNNPTQNNCPFLINSNNRLIITGSFTVTSNEDTWWWERPQTSSFFEVNGSSTLPASDSSSGLMTFAEEGSHLHTTGDLRTSMFGFFYRLMGTDETGAPTDHPFLDDFENRQYGIAPAKKDLHIITFNEAKGTVKDIQTELRYQRNTTQALRHFGSITLSPGRKIPIPGCNLSSPTLNSSNFGINSKISSPSFKKYAVQSTAGTIGSGVTKYKYYHWLVGGADPEGASGAYGESPAYIGSGNFTGVPKIEKFTISKLVKRPNVIMADINKILHLFDGVGGKGFLCIPENINPQIKNNLDYYLKKAELIDKGPNRKNLSQKSPRILREPKPLKGSHLNPDS